MPNPYDHDDDNLLPPIMELRVMVDGLNMRFDEMEKIWKEYRKWAYSWQGRVEICHQKIDTLTIQLRKLVHVLANATDIAALQSFGDVGGRDGKVGRDAQPPSGGATV